MSWDRAKYLAETRALAEATGSQRWSDDTVKRILRLVFQREWRHILNANPTYRFAERSVATDSEGRVALAALDNPNPPSGDSQERFYRVLGVAVGDRVYKEGDWRDYPLLVPSNNYAEELTYIPRGDHLYLVPVESGVTATVWVNHTPTPPDELSLDTVVVTFPRGYELVPCHEAAALMLLKGGAESEAAGDLLNAAAALRADLLADLARRTTNPISFRYGDTRSEWGG